MQMLRCGVPGGVAERKCRTFGLSDASTRICRERYLTHIKVNDIIRCEMAGWYVRHRIALALEQEGDTMGVFR
jgi:hypothetical protein